MVYSEQVATFVGSEKYCFICYSESKCNYESVLWTDSAYDDYHIVYESNMKVYVALKCLFWVLMSTPGSEYFKKAY